MYNISELRQLFGKLRVKENLMIGARRSVLFLCGTPLAAQLFYMFHVCENYPSESD